MNKKKKVPCTGSIPVRGTKKSRCHGGFSLLKHESGQQYGQKHEKNRIYSFSFIDAIIDGVMKNKQQNPIIPYKLAKVKDLNSDLYIELYYWSLPDSKYIRKKIRIPLKSMNRDEKLQLLRKACEEMNVTIKERNEKGIFHEQVVEPEQAMKVSFTVLNWIEKFRNEGEISKDRREMFQSLAFNLEEFGDRNTIYHDLMPEQLNEAFIKEFRTYLKEKGLAGKTINKYLSGIQLLTELLKRKSMLVSSIETKHNRVKAPKNESGRFPPLTGEEKLRAFNYFRENRPEFYLFITCLYYTCIRPAELHRLQVKNFDFRGRKIFVPWYDSKNGLSKYVQMLSPMYEALKDFGVHQLDGEMYLFGNQSGRLIPSFEEYKGRISSDIWLRARQRMDMPENKQLYGLKHTFNVDYIEQNKNAVDWEFLRNHNRHATIQQTQQYISGLTAYFIDETKSTILNYHSSPGKALRK
jgi:integrase